MAVLTTAGKAKIIIGLIVSCVSFFLGVYAFAKFTSSTQEFLDVLANWEMDPIHDIKFVQGTTCNGEDSAGYAFGIIDEQPEYDYEVDKCDCPSGSGVTPTPWTKCTSTQRDRNCTDTTETKRVSVPLWKEGHRPCVSRIPDANALERIRVEPHETCPNGFRKCNVIDCYPATVSCPIIEAKIFASAAAANAAGFNESYRIAPGSATLFDVVGVLRGNASMDVLRTPLHQFRQSGTAGSDDEGQYFSFDSLNAQTLLDINGHRAQLIEHNKWTEQSSRTWYQAYRQEVFWKEDCPADRKTLVNARDDVESIRTALTAVMVISIISFLFNVGLTYMDYKAKTDNIDDNDDKYTKPKKICGITMEVINTVPTLVAMIVAMGVANIFKDVESGACSVESVNADVKALADKVISTASTTMIAKFAVGALYLIYRIIALIRGEKTVEKDGPTGWTPTQQTGPGAESSEMA